MKTCCKDAVGRFCPVCGTPLLDKKLSLKRLLELKDIMMVGQKGEVYTITMPYTTLAEFLGAFEVVSALLFNNEAFGINSYRHTCIKWLDKIAHREKKSHVPDNAGRPRLMVKRGHTP